MEVRQHDALGCMNSLHKVLKIGHLALVVRASNLLEMRKCGRYGFSQSFCCTIAIHFKPLNML
jgi:hypothetical protein